MSNATASRDYRATNRNHGLGWVPWLAALLLAAIVIGGALLALNVNDNNDKSGVDLSDDETSATAGGGTSGAASNGSNADAGASMSSMFQTANGSDLFSLAGSRQLTSVVGQTATATDVTVASVVADEGFWVANNGQQVFVHLTTQARGTGESAPQVAAGQHVDASGTVTRTPSDVSTLGVTASEGAQQLRTEGAYLDATSFRIR